VQTLYQRVLGDKFALLHPVLRRFHSCSRGGGQGRFRVTHFPGRLRRLLARAMRLPAQGDGIAVELEVWPRGKGEVWVRAFPGWRFVTLQTEGRGLLLERDGPVTFVFALDVVDGAMTFTTKEFRLLGVPLPSWAAPSVRAVETGGEGGWTVTVRMSLPFVGDLMEYHGEVVPRGT
jgi:hypothetical protein